MVRFPVAVLHRTESLLIWPDATASTNARSNLGRLGDNCSLFAVSSRRPPQIRGDSSVHGGIRNGTGQQRRFELRLWLAHRRWPSLHYHHIGDNGTPTA